MKILIIDDEMAALAKMKLLLNSYGECTLSTNADQALQLCEEAIKAQKPFKLISIDIQLGDVDGNDLLEKINQLELEAQVPAATKIMVTAMGTAENLVLAHAKGCDAFIVKPVKRDPLDQKMLSLGLKKKKA